MHPFLIPHCSKLLPQGSWALANVICLATESENDCMDQGQFTQGLNHMLYVHVVNILAENLLDWLENVGWIRKDNQEIQENIETSANPIDLACSTDTTFGSMKMSYMDLFRPVCQQWHLMKLLTNMKNVAEIIKCNSSVPNNLEYTRKLELLDIAYLYSYMLRIFSVLNPAVGPLPVLNMLAFTPGFLVNLWEALESYIFPGDVKFSEDNDHCKSKICTNKNDGACEKKQKQTSKDGGNKWVTMLQKITGKSQMDVDLVSGQARTSQVKEDTFDVWDVEPLRCGPQGISKDISCLLHLFCATYSHLLLVLDDIEFYEKQVNYLDFLSPLGIAIGIYFNIDGMH